VIEEMARESSLERPRSRSILQSIIADAKREKAESCGVVEV